MLIRKEKLTDVDKIFTVNSAAFAREDEAALVNALREQATPNISLVAEYDAQIVGHIMFTPVSLQNHSNLMGLAPMAVLPRFQQQGVGTMLVKAGLEHCKKLNIDAVVVLGHPEYYPRFGFSPAYHFGINCEYEAPKEAFMVKELKPGFLDQVAGTVKYHEVFGKF